MRISPLAILETTFAGSSSSLMPATLLLIRPDAYCSLPLKNTGFDFLVTANNHSMDTREAGLLRTIDVIKKTWFRLCWYVFKSTEITIQLE
jgi:hypothetical protein